MGNIHNKGDVKMQKQKTIIYPQGVPSSGKTHNMPLHMQENRLEWNTHNNWTVHAISVALAETEIKPVLENAGYTTILIYKKPDNKKSVGRQIAEAVSKYQNESNVALVIQHQAFDIICNTLIDEKFQCLQDEGSGLERTLNIESDKEHRFEDYFKIEEGTLNKLELTEKGKNSHTALNEDFLELRHLIQNGKRENFVVLNKDGEMSVLADHDGKDVLEMEIWSVPTVDYYNDGTIILTSDKENDQYHQRFKDQINIKEKIMKSRIDGSNRNVIIHAVTDKNKNTRSFRDNNKTFMNEVYKDLKKNVKKSLVFVNEKDEHKIKDTNWITVPTNVHGLNCYKDHHNIILLGSRNDSPNIIKMKEQKTGMDSEEQYRTGPCETFFQMIMRTSLREPTATEDVHVYLLDMYTAKILKEILEDAYGFNVEIKFNDKFNHLASVKNNTIEKLPPKQRRRAKTLANKAQAGTIKYPQVCMKILALSKISKSHRGIIKIDEEYKAKGIKL